VLVIRKVGKHKGLHYQYDASVLEESPDESYGHKMRRLRLLLGLSQRQVAGIVGCSDGALGMWEQDKRHGVSTEAAELPRRIIRILSERLKRRQARAALDTGGLANGKLPDRVGLEPLAPLPKGRVR